MSSYGYPFKIIFLSLKTNEGEYQPFKFTNEKDLIKVCLRFAYFAEIKLFFFVESTVDIGKS